MRWKNKLTKNNLVSSFVVINGFNLPCSPFDSIRFCGETDNYTYDNFGNVEIAKYYAVFSYDDVPNYSAPAIHFYQGVVGED